MLFGLDTDPYSYDDIIDNPWQFKTRNMEKENKYIQFSTFSIGSRVCEIVLKSCPLIQMTRPSDGINFTQSMNLFTYTGVLTFFVGTHEHFAWICSGPWCSRTIVQTQCRQFICHSLMTCSTYSRRAMTGGRQYSLVCTSMVMSRVGRLHSWPTTSASDVVVDVIPDRETEVNHSYSPQLKKTIFYSYFIGGAGAKLRNLHLAVPSLNCDLHMVSNGWPDTYSSTRHDMEDPDTFRISSKIYKMRASIGRRTMPTTTTCLRCTMRISICKFLKSIKFM
jgi:hypothetical protein